MKYFLLVFLMIILSLNLFAETDLKIGGHFRTRYYYRNESAGRTDFVRSRVWVTLAGNLTENIFGMVALENEHEWGSTVGRPDATTGLVYGFTTVNKVFIDPVSVTVGRQPYRLNKNNFVLWDAADGFDGIKVNYKADILSVDLISFTVNDNMASTKDSRLYGLVTNFTGLKEQNLQAYYLVEDVREDSPAVNDSLNIFGLRAEGRAGIPNASYIAEWNMQGGDYGDGSLIYVAGMYDIPEMKKLKLIADYLLVTGGADAFGTQAAMQLPWMEGANNFDHYAEGVGGLNDWEIIGIGAKFAPRDKLTVGFKYSIFSKEDSGDDFANTIDVNLHYQIAPTYHLAGCYRLIDYDDSSKDNGAFGGLEFRVNF